MLETLKHLTGLCGERQPSLLTLIFVTPIFGYLYYNFKNKKK